MEGIGCGKKERTEQKKGRKVGRKEERMDIEQKKE
jgi:hypothetical protein